MHQNNILCIKHTLDACTVLYIALKVYKYCRRHKNTSNPGRKSLIIALFKFIKCQVRNTTTPSDKQRLEQKNRNKISRMRTLRSGSEKNPYEKTHFREIAKIVV